MQDIPMIDSHIEPTKMPISVLEYLKTLRLKPSSVDISITATDRTGVLYVRQGTVIGAECGQLVGNGAYLTLAAIGDGDIQTVASDQPVAGNVSLTVAQVERFFTKLPNLPPASGHCNEEETLKEAVRCFFQFKRKEAGEKLIEVLRSNRFYYPAWLWHSRLMTREVYIKKALNEAKKWGNAEPAITREAQKIEPQFTGSPETARRCIFCWSLIKPEEERCENCRGLQRISKFSDDGVVATEELQQTLILYEEEMLKNPGNSRIAYCLCLGYYSLGQLDRAWEYINKALSISPREPLFVKTSAFLQPTAKPVRKENVPKSAAKTVESPVTGGGRPATVNTAKLDKTVLVVDDSKTARKVVSMVLGRKGYKIVETSTGTEALLTIEGVTPDLVLLDVMLPDMSGFEVLTAIRNNSRLSEVPVVMLTGKRRPEDRRKGMVSGSNEYLTKPFDPAKLLSVLGKYLELPAKMAVAAKPAYIKQAASPQFSPKPVIAVKKPVVGKPVVSPPADIASKYNKADRSVLIVEDSPTARKVITMVLTRKGYRVEEAATGGEALSKVASVLPQLILLDARLPDMTGFDVLAKIKQNSQLKEIPVVMLTAKDNPVDREKGMRAGLAEYLTKPFNPEKLLSVIGGYIEQRQQSAG